MSAVPVIIVGTLTYAGLEIGGGPMPGGPPLGFWGGVAPPVPTHPIAPGGEPPGYWGGTAPPFPTHPIAPGGSPPGYWGGIAPPFPTHPIAPGGSPPIPAHPIVLPPEQPPTEPPTGESGGSWSYSPAIGWYWTSPGGRWVYVAGDKPSPPQGPTQPSPT